MKALEHLKRSLKEFEEIHANMQRLLSDEIMEHERMNWYEPKMSTFRNFLKDVEMWKKPDPQWLIGPQDSSSNALRS